MYPTLLLWYLVLHLRVMLFIAAHARQETKRQPTRQPTRHARCEIHYFEVFFYRNFCFRSESQMTGTVVNYIKSYMSRLTAISPIMSGSRAMASQRVGV